MERAIVSIDLTKNVIQVFVFTNKKVYSNTEMTPSEFIDFLANSQSVTMVFEACGTSNYWNQKAIYLGHDARLISAKLVSEVRQNQKTNKTHVLAIVKTALLPDVTFIAGKSIEQQQSQSNLRLRELCVKYKTATGNQLTSPLLEFNIKVSSRNPYLKGAAESTLEDSDNGLSCEFRATLNAAWQQYLSIVKSNSTYDDCLKKGAEIHSECERLLKLAGMDALNAINL